MADGRNIWNEAMTLTLLDAYEKNELLWNTFDRHYTNKLKREESYADIIGTLDSSTISLRDVKIKLKNLRSSYSGELKKIRDARFTNDAEYIPKVFWFNKMDGFLRHVVVPQHTQTFEDYQGSIYGTKNEYSSDEPIASVPLCSKLVTKKMRLINKEKNHERVKVIKKEEIHDEDLTLTYTEIPRYSEDEFDAFGRNMALQLRSLPLDVALQVQIRMQTILAEVRLALAGQHHRVEFGPNGIHLIDTELDLSNQSDEHQDT